MKPGAGKRKGSAFERTVGGMLSMWLTDGASKTQLVRSVLSGGWSQREARHAGDLAANGPVGEKFRERYVVECKHHRHIELLHMWTRTAGDCLPGWWAKLREECKPGLLPMLVFRANGMPVMVAVSWQEMRHAEFTRSPEAWTTAIFPEVDMMVSSFEDFIAHVPPEFVLRVR